ncbi:hypothetical protein X975_18445, partial [Stegodyphus mimosarum]
MKLPTNYGEGLYNLPFCYRSVMELEDVSDKDLLNKK